MLNRVYREDGHYLVAVRYPGQWHNLQDFVQPDDQVVVHYPIQVVTGEGIPEVSFLPLVVLGLGALGLGGIAAAYAMTRPKE